MSGYWGTPGPEGPQGEEGATGPAGETGPAGPPALAAEGTVQTVDDAGATVVSYLLTDGHGYVLRYKTTAWDSGDLGGYWEHVQVVTRDGAFANVTQDVEVLALESEYADALFSVTTDGGASVRLDVTGIVGRAIVWQTKIYIESDRVL